MFEKIESIIIILALVVLILLFTYLDISMVVRQRNLELNWHILEDCDVSELNATQRY